MLAFYKSLIYFRNASPVLTYGALEESGINVSEVVGYKRTYKNETLLVLNNISDVEVTLNLAEQNSVFTALALDTSKKAKLQAGELTLPAYSTVILKP